MCAKIGLSWVRFPWVLFASLQLLWYAKNTATLLCMDFREGGARNKRKLLHQMCDFFDIRQVPFVVRNLKISGYVFFIGNKLAPILIERKRMEDIAANLSDGRWEEQQRVMRKAQFVLGGGEERNCKICYLIEGSIKSKIVHRGFVGRQECVKMSKMQLSPFLCLDSAC